ncbi:zinc finger protein 28-like [Topomyia yanbarensis]|uniref:zinc finger protein 28-like n=1 Tax=Topomyia yanbarensis TaxID=2498891 RepID=UPI00273BE97E|nr:zinc finger protein 28-like [Topomyia yanbarensis]
MMPKTLSPVVPSRNPLIYCRLCLSQVNLLTMLEANDIEVAPHNELLRRISDYVKITLVPNEDFPSAVCGVCIAQLNDIHEFRQTVNRNHAAVKDYRRSFGDEIIPKVESDVEILVDIYDLDPRLTDFKEEEYFIQDDVPEIVSGQAVETVKDVDVYHMDGELTTVVLKQENLPPARVIARDNKQIKDNITAVPVKPAIVMPHINVLSRKVNPPPSVKRYTTNLPPKTQPVIPEKRTKTLPTVESFFVVKCSQCSAVFRNSENLAIHEARDHSKVREINHSTEVVAAPPKSLNQSITNKQNQQNVLFKCNQCNSSFIQKTNYEKHLKSCQPAILAKLNTSQITIKRTKTAPVNSAPVSQLGEKSHSIVKHGETENRYRCPACPLTYKIQHFLQKHLLDVHKLPDDKEVYYCPMCRLFYSCNEDLQLHNRAIHRFQCRQCNTDFRKCIHSQGKSRAHLGRESNKEKLN